MPASNFSYDGVHVFLTYPQCTLEREQLRDFFTRLCPECSYLIARECHSDGNFHLHAYVHFGRRRRFTTADCFDVEGYHPNIQKPRRVADVVAYCRKEDSQPLEQGTFPSERGNGWGEIIRESRSRDEFLERARERFPGHYVLSLERLLFFCEYEWGRAATPYSGRTRDSFREPASLTEWVTENLREVLICVCSYRYSYRFR